MISEQFDEVVALHRQDLRERLAPSGLIDGHDHLSHGNDAIGFEKHMLGAAEPDPLGAEFAGGARVGGRIGIGANAGLSDLIGPAHQHGEIAGEFRLHGRHLAQHHLALATVDGDEVAIAHSDIAHAHDALGGVDPQLARAGNAWTSHAACDYGGVAGHAAARGEDALRRRACRGCPRGWSRCAPG